MTSLSSIQLKVAEAKQQRDVGRSIARIDSDAMKVIGVTVGDVIEIQGKKTTPAKAWPAYPEDQGLGLIRIDGFLRKNCGVSLNDYVMIMKAELNFASFVELAPVDIKISVDNDFIRFVKDRLIDRPVVKGDTILVMMLGHSVPFIIVRTQPTGIVKISPTTEVNVLGEPVHETGIPGKLLTLESIEKSEDLENLTVSFGKIESEFDAKNSELIISCEAILSFGSKSVSSLFKHSLKEDEVPLWKNIIEKRQRAVEDELKSLKTTIKKLLEASSIKPMKLSLSQLLYELLARTSNR